MDVVPHPGAGPLTADITSLEVLIRTSWMRLGVDERWSIEFMGVCYLPDMFDEIV